MFLPVWGKHIITNPYSKLVTAYPHLSCKLGTILRTDLSYNAPQSCLSRDVPISQHTWDLHIFAAWNTAARVHLNNHNPDWLQGLARGVSEAKWKLDSISSHSTLNSMHADMPGFKKCERRPSDKQQISRGARTVHISNK
eukprot:361142-Pelagomonas_calceolata.AAC.1